MEIWIKLVILPIFGKDPLNVDLLVQGAYVLHSVVVLMTEWIKKEAKDLDHITNKFNAKKI